MNDPILKKVNLVRAIRQFALSLSIYRQGAAIGCLISIFAVLPVAAQSQASVAAQRIDTVIIAIDTRGATPSQITRTGGNFRLLILNRIANPALFPSLQLMDSLGNVLSPPIDLASFQKRRQSAITVTLPPGDYKLMRVSPSTRVFCDIRIQ